MSVRLAVGNTQEHIDNLYQTHATMVNDLNTMMENIRSSAESFDGRAKDAWATAQTQVNAGIQQMHDSARQGAEALNSMFNSHMDADRQGAGQFGG